MFRTYDQGADVSTSSLTYSPSGERKSNPTPCPEPIYEPLRLMAFGSVSAIQTTIKQLHRLNYAEPNEWSKIMPTGKGGEMMSVLTRKIRKA
ncbi:MAG: hypothetical protein AAGD25_17455 [Cyanobacteria bacterium P01_F01_bin.150]